ncbi:MAG: HIT domain-containing protein [Proteobacteria bacterium]|nr:HIT domain-containing protein [Pseudomonadota bacterium]
MLLNCSFCNMANDLDQKIIFQNDIVAYTLAEKHQGALKFSGVIVPKRHRETVFDLTEEEILATFRMLAEVKTWLDDKYKPDGFNIGWNCGEVGGQAEFHAHMHVIPRFKQEPLAGCGIRSLIKSDKNVW